MTLIDAVVEGNVVLVKKLLAEGANPNLYLDEAQVTPLHHAAQNDAIDIALLLLEAGADINAKTSPEGTTPLDVAHLHQHTRMTNLLLAFMSDSTSETAH